ncbi:MAG: hypothetical protein M1370_02445 [Bacteroidetes bacterium]|nr:hypothetical protein [Bacteroidota bacterium]
MKDPSRGKLILLDPTTGPRPSPSALAPRLASLEGISLGLVDNTKDNSDKVLDYIAEILDKDYDFKEVIRHRKKSAGLPPSPEAIADLKQRTQAVITGVGD